MAISHRGKSHGLTAPPHVSNGWQSTKRKTRRCPQPLPIHISYSQRRKTRQKYLNATNKTGYNLTTSNYSYNPPYKTVTGSDPAVFKLYTRTAQLQNLSMSYYYIR